MRQVLSVAFGGRGVRTAFLTGLVLLLGASGASAQLRLRYSTYLNARLNYGAPDAVVATGADGAVYTAFTEDPNPPGPGTITYNVRVVKFAPVTRAVVYSVSIGGSDTDGARSIAVAADGAVWVTGYSNSTDFPLVNPIQTKGPSSTAVLFRLSPAGTLTFSTFLAPGTTLNNPSFGKTVVVDADGSAVWSGVACAPTVPTSPGVFQRFAPGGCDGFIARVSAAGTLIAATYLGGGAEEGPPVLALGPDGDIYVGGWTGSKDLPTSPGAFQATAGKDGCFVFTVHAACTDGYVGRFSSDLTQRRYLTYLRETLPPDSEAGRFDWLNAIAVGPDGDAYVTGVTRSGNAFPTTAGAYRTACFICRQGDIFVTRLNTAGSALVYSTFLGGSQPGPSGQRVNAIAVDASGRAFIGGDVDGSDVPIVNGSTVGTAFVSRFNAQGSVLEYSTRFGGTGTSRILSLALGSDGTAWTAGSTSSTDLPTTPDAWHPTGGGRSGFAGDGFVTGLVPAASLISIDIPATGTITAPFEIGGWAIDQAATGDSGIDAVHVYAYPTSGAGGAPLFLGTAPLGFARPDVAAAFGPQFGNAGWLMSVDSLAAGKYLIVAYGHTELTGAFDAVATRSIELDSRPLLSLDSPSPGAVIPVGARVFVGGWAIDQGAPAGSGIDAVHVWIYPNGGTGTPFFAGVATYGVSRPDVGAAFGSRFTPSGYELDVNGLAPGTYVVAVFAHSTVTNSFVIMQTRSVTIQ